MLFSQQLVVPWNTLAHKASTKYPPHPSPTKNPTLSQPQQKLPGISSDLKNAFSVGSIYEMQRSEQAKCSCKNQDGPLPSSFLKRQEELSGLGKLMLKIMHIHGYFFEKEICPASTVEEIKAEGEAQGHSHNQRVCDFSMNIHELQQPRRTLLTSRSH